MTRKLGKLAPKRDRRTLRLARYLSPEMPQPPAMVDWTAGITDFGDMGNSQYGDCAFAATAHLVQCWTACQQRGPEITISDADVLAAYSAVTGFNPADPSTDNGAAMLDVLKYWRNVGIGGHKIGAFLSVNPIDLYRMKLGAWLFGGVYAGLALPQSAQDQVGRRWEVASGPDAVPGSWGGHAVAIPKIGQLLPDDADIVPITWGALQPMTTEFAVTYMDECYVVLSEDWVCGNGLAPSGFNLQQLQSDLAAL